MSALHKAKQEILTELKKAVGKEYTPSLEDLATPPDPKLGDVTFPCFGLAKGLKRNPVEIASELAAKIGPKNFLKSIVAAGPYVNFTFDSATLGKAVIEEILKEKDQYGVSQANQKRVMVEFASPNTHKEIHVGHLRNFFVGQAVVNVLRANGTHVIPVSYINDLGAHVATCLWGIKKFFDKKLPKKGEDSIQFLGEAYTKAAQTAAENPSVKSEISAIYKDLEQLRGPFLPLWKKTRLWSVRYLKSVFNELELEHQKQYFESELIDDTKKIIDDLIKKQIVKQSDGAWIVDLQEEKLGVNLLVKSDGTLLYNAKDLALALRKEDDFHPQRSIYVVDARQSHALEQLFVTLKKMKFEKELTHLSYEFVTLKEGAMSSRKGNIIRYETFRDAMVDLALQETKKRHPDWKEKKAKKNAEAIAFAAMRFGMLKQDLDKQIVFDIDEALSFDGFTGPYLLYTLARIKSLLKKAKRVKANVSGQAFATSVEHHLFTLLSAYPEIVFGVGRTLHLSSLPQYLFDLSKRFSEFYETVPVLKADSKEAMAARLALVQAVGQVLENGLALLGIPTVKEM